MPWVPLVFHPWTRQKYVVPTPNTWLWPVVHEEPAVWLVPVVVQLITQDGQLVAFGSVGSVELLVATVSQ